MRLRRIKTGIKIFLSILSALFVLIVEYLLNNNPYPIFDDIDRFARLEFINGYLHGKEDLDSDLFLINVSYDKKLVEYNDPETGLPEGNIDITDRIKLLRLLSLAEKSNNYKYIFLDISFDRNYRDNDSINGVLVDAALFEQLRNTPRLVISTHSDIEMADSMLLSKAGINDYYATITSTNLVRYEYLHGSKPSVPLKMYQEIDKKSIHKFGPFYFSENKLCYNSPFLRIPIKFPSKYNPDGTLNFYNLGSDLLDINAEEDCAILFENKIIVIGDFVEDMHDTYVGPQPGSYITINAYQSLVEGKHIINWWFFSILFLVYFGITITLLYGINIFDSIPFIHKSKSKILKILVTFIGFVFLLTLLSDIVFFFTGIISSILFPSLYFSFVSTIIKMKKI